ncbi:MAG: hypothetical protein HUK00_03220 [Bacteroidaceae bacterium]|nr:hypothetical protein [Bacteroidaceae bacterium]
MVKTEKISNMTLLITVAISAIVFLVYLFGGSEPYAANPEFDEPNFTELFIYLMYALIVGAVAACAWAVVRSLGLGDMGGADNRVPAGLITTATIILLAASLVPGLVMGMGAEDFRAADGTITEGYWITVVDMSMWSMYLLSAVLIVLVILSMAGMLSKKVK